MSQGVQVARKIGISIPQAHETEFCPTPEWTLKQIHFQKLEKRTQLQQHLDFDRVNLRAENQPSHAVPGLLNYGIVR